MRIVSLVPSVTETLTAWGRPPVACTRFCERPDLDHVGGTKNPDIERIVRLGADLVVLDAEENRREDHDALVARGVDVHVLHIRSVDDVEPALTGLAARIGAEPAADALPPSRPVHSRAFVPIWRRPWMALGVPTYGASLLARIGIAVVFDHDGPYPETTLAEAAGRHPDLVVAPSEPYPFGDRHRGELETVAPTRLVDGKDLFWWGVRTAGAVARLAGDLGAC